MLIHPVFKNWNSFYVILFLFFFQMLFSECSVPAKLSQSNSIDKLRNKVCKHLSQIYLGELEADLRPVS